jgi:hypothetical protein
MSGASFSNRPRGLQEIDKCRDYLWSAGHMRQAHDRTAGGLGIMIDMDSAVLYHS